MGIRDVVLVTAVGNIGTGSQIIECLYCEKKDNMIIIGCDINDNNIYCRDKLDKLYIIPKVTDYRFKIVMENIIIENHVDIMFISTMQEALWYYANISFFYQHNVKVVLGEKHVFDICMDKVRLFDYLKKGGIKVPRYKRIDTISDCNDVDYYPVVVKPNKLSTNSNNVYIVFDPEELHLICRYMLKNRIVPIAQEWKGDSQNEYCVSVVYDFEGILRGSIAIKRDFSASITRKSMYFRDGKTFIISSGITQGRVDQNKGLLLQAETIVNRLGPYGTIELQGIWENDYFWIIDAQPAITHDAYARAIAGYNEPYFWIEYLLHNRIITMNTRNIRISRKLLIQEERI